MNEPQLGHRQIIISDSSCLIALSDIGELDILHKLYQEILITPEVETEFHGIVPDWITVQAVKDRDKVEEIFKILHFGESSAIALAAETKNPLLVLDDREARKFALGLGFNIIGTIGILRAAYKSGLILDIKTILENLRDHDFYMPPDVEKYFN